MVQPLTEVPAGQAVKVHSVRVGHNFRMKLTALGISIGKELEVLQHNGHGPLIVALKGSRVGIGRKMAEGIMVEID